MSKEVDVVVEGEWEWEKEKNKPIFIPSWEMIIVMVDHRRICLPRPRPYCASCWEEAGEGVQVDDYGRCPTVGRYICGECRSHYPGNCECKSGVYLRRPITRQQQRFDLKFW